MENWVIKNRKADFNQIMEQCRVSEVLARCLVNKGLVNQEEINSYLNPKIENLHDPYSMKDMKKACDILCDKIKMKEKIRIIGDYDVDGVIATYVLYRTLKRLGAHVDYVIPDRIKDGYGINIHMVEAAAKEHVDTILTCDNGIVAIDQVRLAKDYGMTVIITDHHSLLQLDGEGVLVPEADALLNPKQPDCPYPFKDLCGAAIAYKLTIALMGYFDRTENIDYIEELVSYVSIATICDVMELIGENRIIVSHGLSLLRKTQNKGLLALMEVSGIEKEQLTTFHLGFVLGPCINASGRLDHAKKGLELLLSDTMDEAMQMAGEIRTLNETRKEMTLENVEKAGQIIEDSEIKEDKVIVVYLKECHESIAGIIAGRIRERFHRPVIILTDSEDAIKGSARSIDQYNMIEELSKCRDILQKVGGHPMAAGLSLLPCNIDLLRKRLNDNATLTDQMLVPKITIDIHLPFGFISEEFIHELKQLEPFGKGNEKPLFAEKNVRIKSAIIVGKNASGVKLRVENQYNRIMEALYFGDVNAFFSYIGETYGEEEMEKLKTGRRTKVMLTFTYFPKINEYKGYKNIQLMIQNYR